MDFLMQNSRPSYAPMSRSSEDRNDYTSSSWPDQGNESTFEENFNNSINATTQHNIEVLYQSKEEDLCKITLEMNKKILSMSEDLVMAMDVLKKENALLQEGIMTTSLQHEEITKDYEGKIQLLKKKLEGKEALGTTRESMLQELNKKIILEVKMLRAENGTLKKQNGEVSTKIKEFEEQIERREAEKSTSLKELEETKEDFAKRMRLMQAEIQTRDKALEIMKTKEVDHLAKLARSKQEREEMPDLSQASSSAKVKEPNPSKARRRKAKRRNENPPPPPPTKNHQEGIIPNSITMCHHCHTIGHFRPPNQENERHGTQGNFRHRETYRHVRKVWVEKPRNRRSPPRIRKIWVRKDSMNQMRKKGKEMMGKSSTFIWIVKKSEFPNLIKPPLVNLHPTPNAQH